MKLTTIKIRPQRLERWKDIEGYEGLYRISSLGRVKSLNYNHTGKEKILKPRVDSGGYLQVNLSKNGKVKMFLVHRLVLSTFKPIPNMEEMDCNHIDENKANNNIKNLNWMTREENNNWGTRNERGAKSRRIPVIGINIENGEVLELNSVKQGEEFGFHSGNITQCCQGKRKTHKGFKWFYKEEYELQQEISLNLLIMDNIKIKM